MTPEERAEGRSALVRVTDLAMHFTVSGGPFGKRNSTVLRAVDGISFSIAQGETLGLVGESGSGKTTAGRALLQLYQPTSGSVLFDGIELTTLRGEAMRRMRRRMQMIFQDPKSSLDPRMTVGQLLGQPLDVHGLAEGHTRTSRIAELLEGVGLSASDALRYPHEFSGGQQQRIGIARALAVEPSLVVCDEPVSSLDVSIQAQILNLLRHLQAEFALTLLLVAHDLGVVRLVSDRIAVMYLGKLFEVGPSEDLCASPLHPYTRSLMSAVPIPDPVRDRKRKRIILEGDIPSPTRVPSGCRFHTRCWLYQRLGKPDRCVEEVPALRELTTGRFAACHYAEMSTDPPPTDESATFSSSV